MLFSSRTVSVAVLALLLTSGVSVALAAQNGSSLSVAISSPTSGATFNRGETATVTASVTSGGSPVSGATVTATDPTGGKISLSATSTVGTYSAQYAVQSTDPVGTWTIDVQAASGSQQGSASTTASISGALLVALTSPASGTDYNVGQTATVGATVTNQDGTPLPASAAVTFVSPAGAPLAMSVDSADSSGKTWTGSYTIQPSDVPIDGTTWTITVSASYSGNSGSAVQRATLFKSLVVGVSTYGNPALTTPQTNFQVGQTVYVKAPVGLHDGTQVTSGGVSFTITGTTIFSTSMPMTYSLTAAAWTGAYTVLSTDQTGAQTVTVTASDGHGNTGTGSQGISIGVQALTVSITSPSAGSTFNRGEGVTITASASASGVPATSATVTADSPSGGAITLASLGSGVYSARYTVFSTDPTGTWVIDVQASQGGLTGSAQVAATVSSSLDVAVSTWGSAAFNVPQTTFTVGQTVYVEAVVTLQDSTRVSSGTVSLEITGTGAATTPVAMTYSAALDSWTGAYTVTSSDVVGVQTVSVSSADGSGNSGTGSSQLTIGPSSQALAVSFVSPAPGTAFQVGDNVGISATVTLGGSPFAGATVTATSPTGAAITLTSAGGGSYAGSYMILGTDPTGAWTITLQAVYNGGLAASQEQVTISPTSASALSVSCSPASSPGARQAPGDGGYFQYACTATVAGTPSPQGNASFATSSSTGFFRPNSASCHPAPSGSCTVDYLDSSSGSVTITVTYRATPSGGPSSTASTTFVIPKAVTTTALVCVPANGRGGSQGWVCRASVDGVNATGTVAFSATAGTLSASSCTLGVQAHGHDSNDDRGRGDDKAHGPHATAPPGQGCTFSFEDTSAGAATVTATYSGDSNNLGSTSSVSISVSSDGLALACEAAAPRQAFVYRCYVETGASPPGTVSFSTSSSTGTFQPKDASCPIGPGHCSVTYLDTSAGSVTVTAKYQAHHGGAGGSVATTFVISKAPTTTSVSCRPSQGGSAWDCTAVVSGVAPTGTVAFTTTAGSLSAGSCTLVHGPGPVGYSCGVTLSALPVGETATVSAVYGGDGENLGSASSATVRGPPSPASPSTSVTSIACSVTAPRTLRCSVSVRGADPSGQVTFTSSSPSGSFSSSTCALSHGGDCAVTYSQTATGTVTLTASYSGDSDNLASAASVTLTLT